jgi:hypothetical protein
MVGTIKPKMILEHKDTLVKSSLKFAQFENPDFIIMKEAILCFEKIVINQVEKTKRDVYMAVSDEDKTYIFKMISVLNNKFGTQDSEWFCAAETILNTLFNIKSRNSHEYAKLFIEQLVRKLYIMPENGRRSEYQSMVDENGIVSADGIPMR